MKMHFLALGALLASTAASADILISNVNGIQADANGNVEHFTGILIGNDGKVKRLLHGEMLKLRDTDVVDGRGQTVMPGLIDAHGHFMELGYAALQLDLTGTSSLADLQGRLKAYAAANPQARWIVGRGWNQELWPVKNFPTAADLDAVVSDRPVVLRRVDGHALVANSTAMRAAGVSASTPAPAGGRVENGLFVDNAMDLIEPKIPQATDAEADAAAAKAQEIMLGFGLTAAGDMGTDPSGWAAMNRAGEAGRLNVRIMSYSFGLDTLKAIALSAPTDWKYGDRLHMGGVKFYADGALGSRGAWLKQPYSDKPDTHGLKFHSDAEMRDITGKAAAMGFQVATHAIGDAANAQAIADYEGLSRQYGTDRRWRIEHAQVVDPIDIPRIAKAGIIASMQPTHQTSDRLMAEKRLGPDRLAGAYAWTTILNSGAKLAFGSDFPVESPNPFPGISAAISRQDLNGQPPGGWRPQESVSLGRALHGFSRGAAYAGFAEDRIGSLDPGMWADFIFVDRDPTKVDPQSLGHTQVLETWVAGKKVWAKSSKGAGAERGL
ncbi:amidohydrolase [Sphingomonas alba]|uniref:Amidohydrolase family protein n=1 Tax=Sphingomonas alba TaxID=2908208 RepID=A0ABT0RL44_9SPHN|nr:amidohydrolase [Sphingomonas alba]MCL6683293.1 amidohydrolase family protein [Sphingomonas alba]